MLLPWRRCSTSSATSCLLRGLALLAFLLSSVRMPHLASAAVVDVGSGASPSPTDDCVNLKTTHGTTQCRELHSEAQYYALWNPANVASDTHLTVKLVVKNPTTGRNGGSVGYVAFGINKTGGMKGADIVLVNKSTGSWAVEDFFSDSYDTPIKDALQNWELVSSNDDSATGLVFEIRRELDTCDWFDLKIIEMEFFCLWAFGSSYDFVHHGTTRGAFGCELTNRSIPTVPGSGIEAFSFPMFDGTNHNTPANVLTTETSPGVTRHNQYVCSWMRASDIFGVDTSVEPNPVRSVVAIDPILDNGGPFVHHLLLYGCEASIGSTPPATNYDCLNMPSECSGDLIYAWAVGGGRIVWPTNVGLTIGDATRDKIYMLNMHYYNPNLLEGQTDASGFKLYSLPQGQTRDIELGTWLIGPVSFQQRGLQTKSYLNMYCPVECFEPTGPEDYESPIESKDVNMAFVLYHSHFDGRRQDFGAWSIDNNSGSSVMTKESFNNFKVYDYNHQTFNNSEKPTVSRGSEGLYLNCHWDFKNRDTLMSWGDGSNDEMCFGAALTWPKQPKVNIGPCGSEIPDSQYSWVAGVRAEMMSLCETHCDGHASADDFPVPKNTNDDLFPHQSGYTSRFTSAVTTPKATQIADWKAWCKACNTKTNFQCDTCTNNANIANDDYCAKAAHKGICPTPAGVNTPASDATIDAFVESEIAKRNNRLCVTWCKAGKHGASLWSCQGGGYSASSAFGVGPVSSESQKFAFPTNTCAKQSLAVKTADECTSHSQCSTVSYCAAGKNAFTSKTPIERIAHNPVITNRRQLLGNDHSYLNSVFGQSRRKLNAVSTSNDLDLRNWCGSCSRCCQMVDGFDGSCPEKCSCTITSAVCQAQGKIFCEGHTPSQNSCVDLPSTGTEANQCYSVCPHPDTSPYMVFWSETRSCQRCIDHDAEYTRRIDRYAGNFGSGAGTILNTYRSSCRVAPMLMQLLGSTSGISAEQREPIERELRELCLYTFRDEATIPCGLSTGPVLLAADAPSSSTTSADFVSTEGIAGTVVVGVIILAIGLVGVTAYGMMAAGLLGGSAVKETSVTAYPMTHAASATNRMPDLRHGEHRAEFSTMQQGAQGATRSSESKLVNGRE